MLLPLVLFARQSVAAANAHHQLYARNARLFTTSLEIPALLAPIHYQDALSALILHRASRVTLDIT